MPTAPFWPFSIAELTAGLRRYFADPAVTVVALSDLPLPRGYMAGAAQRVRGLRVDYVFGAETRGPTLSLNCVVKELRGASRAGLAGAGLREVGLYRALATQLPVATPALITADLAGSWLVFEAVEAHPTQCHTWQPADFHHAVRLLAALHERFWGLAGDLDAYKWLARPLTRDYEIHVYAAAQALDKIIYDEWPAGIAASVTATQTLAQLITHADWIIQPLRAVPFALLHGDFGPHQLLRDDEGEFIVVNWHHAAIGPGVLDLVCFLTNAQWNCDHVAARLLELQTLYREEIARCANFTWTDEQWAELWEHAFLWRFMQETLTWVTGLTPERFKTIENQFQTCWLDSALAIAARRLAHWL